METINPELNQPGARIKKNKKADWNVNRWLLIEQFILDWLCILKVANLGALKVCRFYQPPPFDYEFHPKLLKRLCLFADRWGKIPFHHKYYVQ